MDEQLQAKIDEAKANGYSDEEIQNFLATKDQPIAQEQPIDRSGEYGATAELMGASLGMGALETAAKAAEYGIPAAVAYKALTRPPTTPVSPAQAAQAGQSAQNYRVAGTGTSPITYNAPTTVPSTPNLKVVTGGATPVAPEGMSAPASTVKAPTSTISAAQSIVQKLALDKVLKGAGAIGAGIAIGEGLFGTSDEEVRKMKEAEARKRAQGWKPLNER